MCSSFSVASVACHAAHNSGQILVHAAKWVHFCKIWFNLHASLNFCKLSKRVNTCYLAWDLKTSSRLSSLSWALFQILSATPTGQLFFTMV